MSDYSESRAAATIHVRWDCVELSRRRGIVPQSSYPLLCGPMSKANPSWNDVAQGRADEKAAKYVGAVRYMLDV